MRAYFVVEFKDTDFDRYASDAAAFIQDALCRAFPYTSSERIIVREVPQAPIEMGEPEDSEDFS